jgi:hypothetical protein
MADLRRTMSAALGLAPSQEVVDATRGVDRRVVRQVRGRVRRGEVEQDALRARLAVALAREHLRLDRAIGLWSARIFAVAVASWAAMGVDAFLDRRIPLGGVYLALVTWGLWLLVMRPRWRRNAAQAERRNRDALAAPGLPEGAMAAASRRERVAEGLAVAAWLVLLYGILLAAADGDPLSAGVTVAGCLLFGALMTVFAGARARRRS